jgi:hypothetical protein
LIHLNTYALIRLKNTTLSAEIFFSEPGLDPQKFLLLEAGLQRLFFQSQDWIGRNSFFSKPGCRDFFFRARTGSAEIPSSRSRAAEIISPKLGLDPQKFFLL